jgi:hypothetical protein
MFLPIFGEKGETAAHHNYTGPPFRNVREVAVLARRCAGQSRTSTFAKACFRIGVFFHSTETSSLVIANYAITWLHLKLKVAVSEGLR